MNDSRDHKGRFLPGNKVTRTGSPNRTKKDLEQRVKELVEGNITRVKRDIKTMKPRERVRAIVDLMKYVLPAKRAVDSSILIENLSDDQLDRIIEEILLKHTKNE